MSVKAMFSVPSYIKPFAGSLAVLLAHSHVFGKGRSFGGTGVVRSRCPCFVRSGRIQNPFGLQFHTKQWMPSFVLATKEGALDRAEPVFWRAAAKTTNFSLQATRRHSNSQAFPLGFPARVHSRVRDLGAVYLGGPCFISLRSRQPSSRPAISYCFAFLFPPPLAWHSLGLKPCARRLKSFCFTPIPRALRVPAPPPTFQNSRKTSSMKSCRSPRKSTPPGLGAAAARSLGAQAKRAEKE
jgi:hypothetical protein